MDTFTHQFCANGHGWTIGTSFPYIRTSKRQYSTPVQYTCISSCLSWLYFALQALSLLKPYNKVREYLHCCALCCATLLTVTPIVRVTLLFSYKYISQACWVLCSPRLDFFHRTVISTLVAANRLRSPLPLLLDPSQSYFIATSLSDKLWLTTSHQKCQELDGSGLLDASETVIL